MALRLRIVQGRPHGQDLCFAPGEYLFGRGNECHVRPNSEWVSREHCLLRVGTDGVWLRDLGSRNGTLVNGTRLLAECNLHPGDLVEVGPLVFLVQFDPSHLGTAEVGADTVSCVPTISETLFSGTGTRPEGPLSDEATPPGGIRPAPAVESPRGSS
jgi:predicted component of type VI protein secretion system